MRLEAVSLRANAPANVRGASCATITGRLRVGEHSRGAPSCHGSPGYRVHLRRLREHGGQHLCVAYQAARRLRSGADAGGKRPACSRGRAACRDRPEAAKGGGSAREARFLATVPRRLSPPGTPPLPTRTKETTCDPGSSPSPRPCGSSRRRRRRRAWCSRCEPSAGSSRGRTPTPARAPRAAR